MLRHLGEGGLPEALRGVQVKLPAKKKRTINDLINFGGHYIYQAKHTPVR